MSGKGGDVKRHMQGCEKDQEGCIRRMQATMKRMKTEERREKQGPQKPWVRGDYLPGNWKTTPHLDCSVELPRKKGT